LPFFKGFAMSFTIEQPGPYAPWAGRQRRLNLMLRLGPSGLRAIAACVCAASTCGFVIMLLAALAH